MKSPVDLLWAFLRIRGEIMRIRVGVYDLTLEISGLKSFSQSPRRENHAKCAEVDFIRLPLGVLCVHLILGSL